MMDPDVPRDAREELEELEAIHVASNELTQRLARLLDRSRAAAAGGVACSIAGGQGEG